MNREEHIAEIFLRIHFGSNPIFEPRGKCSPPDFSLGRTAFEVRRLNQQHVYQNGTAEGLEQVDYSLSKKIRAELGNIQFSPAGGSFYWVLDFQRPLGASPSKIAKRLGIEARACYSRGLRARTSLATHGVTLELLPAANPGDRAFLPGIEIDGNSGGMVAEIYATSIGIALQEKIKKTQSISKEFDFWVLVLVDSIMPEVPWSEDLSTLNLELRHFNSIVVIDPDSVIVMDWPHGSLQSVLEGTASATTNCTSGPCKSSG